MGCVSSTLLNHEDDFSQIGSSALGHHIVSLTSTTYGLLTLDPPPSSNEPPPPLPRSSQPPISFRSDPPEVINSWELMAGLVDPTPTNDSCSRFSLLPPLQPSKLFPLRDISNITPLPFAKYSFRKHPSEFPLHAFEQLCPPNGENRVVIYTTTLRGVRKTFEACNAVRSAFEGFGVLICERDISMDRGFKEELRVLMKDKDSSELVPPRVFLKGRYVGGAEELMRIVEEGCLGELLQGLPKLKNAGHVCEGCGGVRFFPCSRCNGSCKIVMQMKDDIIGQKQRGSKNLVVLRCSDCNENGLVLCPICT